MSLDIAAMILEEQQRAAASLQEGEPELEEGSEQDGRVDAAEPEKDESKVVPEESIEELHTLPRQVASTGETVTQYASSQKVKPSVGGRPSEPNRSKVELVQMRNFPASVVAIAQQEFPTAKNRADALAAYVIVKSDCNPRELNVSPEIRELVRNYKGDKSASNVAMRLDMIERRQLSQNQELQMLTLGLSYLLFDRLGYRRESLTKGPRSVNMLETGVADLMARMREQARQYAKQEAIRTGRPQSQSRE